VISHREAEDVSDDFVGHQRELEEEAARKQEEEKGAPIEEREDEEEIIK
jgi:hypothetical protein